jgi:hypothetical protein
MQKPSVQSVRGHYIHVDNVEEARQVEKALFNLGFRWSSESRGQQREVRGYKSSKLFAENDYSIMHCSSSVTYGLPELDKQALFDLSDQMRAYKRWKKKDSRQRKQLQKQGWIRHDYRKGQPVSDDTIVTTKFSDNSGSTGTASRWCWDDPFLMYYKIEKPADVVVSVETMFEDIAKDMGKGVAKVVIGEPIPAPDTNPKRQYGVQAIPLNMWSPLASAYGALGLYNGSLKYGKANFANTPVEASIYIAAAFRHLSAWACGQEDDPADGVPNLGGVLANIAILLEARASGMLIDDRLKMAGYLKEIEMLRGKVKHLNELHAGKNPKHYTLEG